MTKQKVRQLLREAFQYSDLSMCDHDDYVELRHQMIALDPVCQLAVIPRVLDELLDTHTGDSVDTDEAEYVVMTLDVDVTYSKSEERRDLKSRGLAYVNSRKEDHEERRQRWRKDFLVFNKLQCKAIYTWLLYTRGWPEFSNYQDLVKGALAYWRRRMQE